MPYTRVLEMCNFLQLHFFCILHIYSCLIPKCVIYVCNLQYLCNNLKFVQSSSLSVLCLQTSRARRINFPRQLKFLQDILLYFCSNFPWTCGSPGFRDTQWSQIWRFQQLLLKMHGQKSLRWTLVMSPPSHQRCDVKLTTVIPYTKAPAKAWIHFQWRFPPLASSPPEWRRIHPAASAAALVLEVKGTLLLWSYF